jgi:hypothetical protein
MATFILDRFIHRHELQRAQARALDAVLCEVDAMLENRRQSKLPGDPLSLRGIPVIGRGVGGAVRGTRPDLIV